MDFLVDRRRLRDRPADLLPQNHGVLFAESMNQSFCRTLTHSERLCNLLVRRRALSFLRADENLEDSESRPLPSGGIFLAQSFNGVRKQGHCPSGIKDLLWREIICGLEL